MNGTINSNVIAKNIKCIRLSNKLTQDAMALKLGYSVRQYRRLETKGTYNICVINLIAETFNIQAMGILLNENTL